MLMKAVSKTVDKVQSKISNLRYGDAGSLFFEYDDIAYVVEEPMDILPIGAGDAGDRWAA